MISMKNIPDSLLSIIRERFEREKNVRDLRILQQLSMRKGNLRRSMEISEEIEALFADVVRLYIEEAEKKQVIFDTETNDLPQEDKEKMLEQLLTLFMCCDIIESSIIGVNDVLHKTKKDLNISAFDDISQAMQMAQEKLKYLSKNGDYMSDSTWGNQCDNMYEMMQNKAKAIIRKRKEKGDEWGKNTRS